MRGKIDTPMSETANISLLEKIVAAQRNIIADVYQTNAAAVPQDWALYKEVQEYYEKGMRVPDDVTLVVVRRQLGRHPPVCRRPEEPATQLAAPGFITISIMSAGRAITNGSTPIRPPKSGSR